VFSLSASGEARELVRPEGAQHIWDLAWDTSSSRLYAATGPEGKVFVIDESGRADVYYDGENAHVLALALHSDGTLFAGTDGDALLLELQGPGRVRVIHDFEEQEVTALTLRGDRLGVATNTFPAATSTRSKAQPSEALLRRRRPRPGKGRAWRVDTSGRVERVFHNDEAHFTSIEMAEDGNLFVGSAAGGRIFAVTSDGQHSIWADIDERQVLALNLNGEAPFFLSGDAGALYRIQPGAQSTSTWTSAPLDSVFQSRWGQLNWRGEGSLQLQTRSGNTSSPDASWSDWSAVISSPGPIRSPAARYLQVRATLPTSDSASLRAVEAFYLPQNQPARVHAVNLAPHPSASSRRNTKTKAKLKTASSSRATRSTDSSPAPSSQYRINWQASNPDGDPLRYRLRYRADGSTVWRLVNRAEESVTATHYDWETTGLADGWYVVEVEASDELLNPDELTIRTTARSEPSLIDNHPPRIERLRVSGGAISGVAIDTMGPIHQIEYALNGGDWHQLHPSDGLFDTSRENFAFTPSVQSPGLFVVAVRVRDAAGNQVTDEVEGLFGR